MPELSEAQRRELAALRQAFEAELPQKVTAIAGTAASLGTGPWDRSGLEGLLHLAHRLAGSSAIWGFTAVSDAASELEELITSALERVAPPTLATDVQRLVAALQQAVEQGRGHGGSGPAAPAC